MFSIIQCDTQSSEVVVITIISHKPIKILLLYCFVLYCLYCMCTCIVLQYSTILMFCIRHVERLHYCVA